MAGQIAEGLRLKDQTTLRSRGPVPLDCESLYYGRRTLNPFIVLFVLKALPNYGSSRLLGFSLGHFQVGSYRSRSLMEGLYTL